MFNYYCWLNIWTKTDIIKLIHQKIRVWGSDELILITIFYKAYLERADHNKNLLSLTISCSVDKTEKGHHAITLFLPYRAKENVWVSSGSKGLRWRETGRKRQNLVFKFNKMRGKKVVSSSCIILNYFIHNYMLAGLL